MDVRNLKTFIKVAELSNFTKAAAAEMKEKIGKALRADAAA